MQMLSVAEIAKKWNISERSVRNYCSAERIPGAELIGKVWKIPADAVKPADGRKRTPDLLEILQEELSARRTGGIYHKIQIDLTYNSNHMEGSRLTHDQTRYIYETNTIGMTDESVCVDDIIETVNHFRCVEFVIQNAKAALTERCIKELHAMLKTGTSDSRLDWFAVGDYKKLPNEVGGRETALPEEVPEQMRVLLRVYHGKKKKTLEDLIDFHVQFERIHPFQDGNGRIGRLILFKECLKHGIVPFIIGEDLKLLYYRGLQEWGRENGYLTDTLLTAQDRFKKYLDYFRIPYTE